MKAKLYAEAALIVWAALVMAAAPFAVYPFIGRDPVGLLLFAALAILACWTPLLAALCLAAVRRDLRQAARR